MVKQPMDSTGKIATYLAVVQLAWSMRVQLRTEFNESLEEWPSFAIGRKGQSLIPGMVPPIGEKWTFANKEKRSFLGRNDYKWILVETCNGDKMKRCDKKEQPMLKLKGGFFSNLLGHQAVSVKDGQGNNIFMIQRNSMMINPFQMRNSIRILPPGAASLDETLFTINRDIFGRGFLWWRDEWRVYQGRKHEGKQIYYAVGGYWKTWSRYKVFELSEREGNYKKHRDKLAGTIYKKKGAKAFISDVLEAGDWIPDKYKIEVMGGHDSALFLTLSIIIDMRNDWRERTDD